MDIDKLKEFVELDKRKRDLKDELKVVQSDINRLEEELLPQFAEAGIQNMKVDGMMVYLKRTIRAGIVSEEDRATEEEHAAACQALRDAGLDDYVRERFNLNSLSALVREWEKEGEPMPESFEGRIRVTEQFNLSTRKS